MDRIDFSKSIDVDPITQVRCYFNETMAMYDLVEGLNYNYNLLRGFINNDNMIQFSVSFNSPMEASSVANEILNREILLYNKIFHIDGNLSNTELSLIFIQQSRAE